MIDMIFRNVGRYKPNYNYESNQQDATVQVNLLFLVSSTCFGRCFRPSSGALDCIYSILYKFVIAINTTRYCKYSQVLLMIGENIARNM